MRYTPFSPCVKTLLIALSGVSSLGRQAHTRQFINQGLKTFIAASKTIQPMFSAKNS
jgi:hypothetical protein